MEPVKKGYKKTEVGVIPEDWVLTKVGDRYEICNHLRFPISQKNREQMQGMYPYYGPTKAQDFINEYRLNGTFALIGEDGDHFLKWKETPMTQLVSGKFNVNNHAHVIKGNEKAATEWFYYFFLHRDITNFLSRQGAGRYKLNKGTLISLPIYLPPTLKEQKAIADALSDVDELIASLEKLIAKKKAIKQGTMQALLTPPHKGGKRLEGFSGEWKEVRLEEVGISYAGGTPSTFNSNYWNGSIIWLPSGRVQNDIINKLENEKTITQLGLEESAAKLIKTNSVLIAITGATCGNIGLLEFEATANQSVVAIEPNENYDYKFLFYQLLMNRTEILKFQTGSAQGGVNLNTIKKIRLCFPRYDEQLAISKILNDMHFDILSLEKRLSKSVSLKQGMMQELLTGKTRLV